jgi:hypothetical protein
MIGTIEDNFSADFAREILGSYDIPAVIISRSGFFGKVGLTFMNFHSGSRDLFEVSVPEEYREEAGEVLSMTIGNKWKPED